MAVGFLGRNCGDGWCTIEPGCFIMGSPWCEWGRARDSANPVQVTLTHRFRIQQFETTQAQWTAEGLPNPSGRMTDGTGDCLERDCPVGNITWTEALAFANLLSRREGFAECYVLDGCSGDLGAGLACDGIRSVDASVYDCPGYRLPTGAEWEYAARAGTRTTVYAGDVVERGPPYACRDDPVLLPIAWYCANAGSHTHPVGLKRPNGWGLYDAIGNAQEWVGSDVTAYGPGTYVDWGAGLSLTGLLDLGAPAMQTRGGGWNQWPNTLRVSSRGGAPPWAKGPGLGFRLAQTLQHGGAAR